MQLNKLAKFVRTPMFEGKYETNECETIASYDLLNRYIFDNGLERPQFNIKRTRGYWGMTDGRMNIKDERFFVKEIILTNKFPHKAMFIATLAHEMIHQFQWEVLSPERLAQGKDSIMSHGPSFFVWRKVLSEYMIPLRRQM
jgi:hypothetical protein